MNDIEEALRRTFARAEERIPTMPPDLLREVTAPPARRRGRGLLVASVAATALVIWGVSAVTGRALEPRPAVTQQPAVTSGPTPPVRERRIVEKIAAPVEQVLPSVVAEVPMRAPNGKAFTPEVFLDAGTMLGRVSKKGYDPAPEWWSYHLKSQTFERLATLDAPVGQPVVGDGVIAWSKDVGRNIHIMTVPVTGGVPRTVVSFPAERDVDEVNGDSAYGVDLAVGDGRIFWSSTKSGGVRQVPVSGGEASFVPGTEGLRLFRWPWAGRPGDHRQGVRELLNLSTGERLGDPARAQCDVTWCISGDQAIRRDGGKTVDLPGDRPISLVADRFVTLSQLDKQGRKAEVIFDLATSRVGRLWLRNDHKPSPTLHTTTDTLRIKRDDTWIVIHG